MYARGLGLGGACEPDRAPVQPHLAAVGREQARGDLHQCGLARAVFAHECVHLACLQVEARAVEREHTREALGNVGQF